ncbi:MAG: hypothetical protein JNK32_04315 [Anaerolineales bacterium]|nr:hypothetical protein [Anaerolineales bacterium]
MPQPEPTNRHQLQIIREDVDDIFIFEAQPNLPHIGEYVVIFDKDGTAIIEGRVKDIRWAYIEELHGSSCTVYLAVPTP